MYCTPRERTAIAFVVKRVIIADGQIDKAELIASTLFFNALGVKMTEIVGSDSMEFSNVVTIIKQMSREAKQMVSNIMAIMSTVDGDVDVKEVLIFTLLQQECNLPDPQRITLNELLATL